MARSRWVTVLATIAVGCGAASSGPTPLEDRDPARLVWYTPATDGVTAATAGQPFDLGVATQNADVTLLHFAVDGREVGACDASQDCHAGNLWRFTTVIAASGTHTLEAWYAAHDGAMVRESRAVWIADRSAAQPAADSPAPAAATERDPVTEQRLDETGTGEFDDPAQEAAEAAEGEREVADDPPPDEGDEQSAGPAAPTTEDPTPVDFDFAQSPMRGYLDPSLPMHGVFGGIGWSVVGQRVVLAGGVSLDGDVFDVSECYVENSTSFRRYSDQYRVSRASLVAAAIAATDCDPEAPGGIMGVRRSTCAAIAAQGGSALDEAACAARMAQSADFAIEIAARWLASDAMMRLHHNDPVLLAAAFSSGSITPSRANRWHLVAPPDHTGQVDFVTSFVAAYNAFRTGERTGEVAHDE